MHLDLVVICKSIVSYSLIVLYIIGFHVNILINICILLILSRHRGVYLGQDVAVKILRSETLNEALEDEFRHEVAILR